MSFNQDIFFGFIRLSEVTFILTLAFNNNKIFHFCVQQILNTYGVLVSTKNAMHISTQNIQASCSYGADISVGGAANKSTKKIRISF